MESLQGIPNLGYNASLSDGLDATDVINPIRKSSALQTSQKVSNVRVIQRTCSLPSRTRAGGDSASKDQHRDRQFHGSSPRKKLDRSPLTMTVSKPPGSAEALSSVAGVENYKTFVTSRNNSGTDTSKRQLLKKKWILSWIKYGLTYPLICLSVWAMFYIFWGEMAFPRGPLFALIILEVSAISLGHLAGLLGLPPLLGMLIAGLILRNVPYINVAKDLELSISSPLRGISVVILLSRGAFSVNPLNIKKFKRVVPPLAIGSCVLEAICGGVAAYYVIGFPPAWAALMGCILSAMSGVAVMPYLLDIEKHVKETDLDGNAIPRDAIIIAKTGCGLDAILAICMAEFSLGFIFGDENIQSGFTKGPAEVAIGGTFGALWGSTAGLLLDQTSDNDLRILAIFSGGVMSLLGLYKIGYPRGGPLGVFLGSLVAVSIWRYRKIEGLTKLSEGFDKLWFIFQPLLFGILGARTDFGTLDWTVVSQGAICLLISTLGRLVSSFLSSSWSSLSFRERIFLVVAWMPKGTVQAALGPVALDTAFDLGSDPTSQSLANKVMNIAATTVVLSSILGSLALKVLGPRLLKNAY